MSNRLACACVVLALAMLTHRYAAVWQNEITLWSSAVQRAPLKPRPHVHLSLALIERRQFAQARAVLDYADALTTLPHVPVWDRVEAIDAIRSHRHLVSRLEGY